jgi:hypothetical protein
MDNQLTIENKPKRKKTGGKTTNGMLRYDATIKVAKADKPSIAEFRDYLNNELSRDVALSMLIELKRMTTH